MLVVVAMATIRVWAGFDDLARTGDWRKVLEIALRRGDQLPLNPSEALIAAAAAEKAAETEARLRFLDIATGAANEQLRHLAEIQLAELVIADDPDLAVELVTPAFGRGFPWPLREAAADVARSAVKEDLDASQRGSLEAAAKRLPRSLRRNLELELALTDSERGRERLERLLASSTRDLAALEAAEALIDVENPSAKERWRVAQTYYRHAMYDRAAPMFEKLSEVRNGSVPRDEAAFLRGRCAFRRDRWEEAIEWYQRALRWERSTEKKSEIEVHIGRCRELEGDLDGAVDAALRAVRLKTTDDRRLFLARLRLRRGEPALAEQGIARLRSRSKRARGEIMLAVDAVRRGDLEPAQRRLERVKRAPWSIPAAVLAAELAAGRGDAEGALQLLDRVDSSAGQFWVDQAQIVMSGLPEMQIEAWRLQREQDVGRANEDSLWPTLGRWAVLEADKDEIRLLRGMVGAAFASFGSVANPTFSDGLAGELWSLGLDHESARWDPAGWPKSDAVVSAWTASQLLENGFPWRAIRSADGAWRQAGSVVPISVLPESLRRSLYPLPDSQLVRKTAREGGIHWSLLAGVAREESRWDPTALSVVGARGLVQLMPATAVAVAKASGLPAPTPDDLFEPRLNLRLGATELGRLVVAFEGRWAPAVAAYNAGEAQATEWLKQCGPDCTSELYLLNISFSATRVYTANVLSAAVTYRELYGNSEQALDGTQPPVSD
jgi:tetratricopeptide (TPR) repeat protein